MRIYCQVLLSLFAFLGSLQAQQLFVSPQGNDTWSGKLETPARDGRDGPLATLQGARDALRKMERSGTATVQVLPGNYSLTEEISFAPEDGNVTYQGDSKKRPVFSGGKALPKFTAQANGLWTLRIPEVASDNFYFEQLFINGRRAVRARSPNKLYYYMKKVRQNVFEGKGSRRPKKAEQIVYAMADDIAPLIGMSPKELKDVNMLVYHKWDNTRRRLDGVDGEKNTISTIGMGMKSWNKWHAKTRYHLENFKAALDAPGEWFLERNGTLYYKPLPGERVETTQAIVPLVKSFLSIKGSSDTALVNNLHFNNISFQHARCLTPESGYEAAQAAAYLPASIMVDGAENVTFKNCEIARIGTYAIWFRTACRNSGIFASHLHDLGAGAVRLGNSGIPKEEKDYTEKITVDNCIINNCGNMFPCAVGIWIGQTANNQVTHNEICDLFYSGISVGWRWGYGKSLSKNNIVTHNHIHHIGYGVLSDMGAVYTLGPSAGTKINNNVIHDVHSYSYGGWGLYTDEGSSNIEMANNLVYNTKSGGFHQHYGRDNKIHNNIFAFSELSQIQISRIEKHRSIYFQNNIVIYTDGGLFTKNASKAQLTMEKNCYWNTTGEAPQFCGKSLTDWQALGRDENSIVADPKFINPEARDFRLHPDSPALKLGFVPFDYSQAGVYGKESWKQLASSLPVREIQRVPPPKPIPVEDDFEDYSVGKKPESIVIRNEERHPAITVSNEAAATGKQSLRIQNGPEFKHSYNPHFYYHPNFSKGTFQASFDLQITSTTNIAIAARDYSGGNFTTGAELKITNGNVLFAGKTIPVPAGQWLHFQITGKLNAPKATWELGIKIPGQEIQSFQNLKNKSRNFKKLTWLGLSTNDNVKDIYYFDNILIKNILDK
jgi:hypothetical protein